MEVWHHYAQQRQDLYGVIDLVALHPSVRGLLGVQATTASNMSARVHKAEASEALRLWLRCGNPFQVWGWVKRDARWRVRKGLFQLGPGDDLVVTYESGAEVAA